MPNEYRFDKLLLRYGHWWSEKFRRPYR